MQVPTIVIATTTTVTPATIYTVPANSVAVIRYMHITNASVPNSLASYYMNLNGVLFLQGAPLPSDTSPNDPHYTLANCYIPLAAGATIQHWVGVSTTQTANVFIGLDVYTA